MVMRAVSAMLVAVVVAVAAGAPPRAEALRLGAAAPEIAGAPWINSAPLTLAALRGRVVLVDFWAFG